MNLDEDKLKTLMNEDLTYVDEDKSLEKVLSDGKKVTAAKDVASMFVGWVWVVFLGFGASLYSAKRQFQRHQEAKNASPLNKKVKTIRQEQ